MVKGRRCNCSKKYDDMDGRGQYPAGLQKEDLLWAYFVMRMICDVLGEPGLMDKIQAPAASNNMTPFDLAMLCCAVRNPGALNDAVRNAKIADVKCKEAAEAEKIVETTEKIEKTDTYTYSTEQTAKRISLPPQPPNRRSPK